MADSFTSNGEAIRARTAKAKEKRFDGEEDNVPKKVDFVYEGDKMVIPEDMSLDDARDAIIRQIDEEAVTVQISEIIKTFPLDGAYALMRVLKRRYGWTNLKPTPGFWGPTPPTMVGVEVNFNEHVQVPWGSFTVPKVDGTLTTTVHFEDGMPLLRISGTVRRRHERIIASIAEEIRLEVKEHSIYRFKAVKINFRDQDGNRKEFDANLAPRFLDLSSLGDTSPIFSRTVEDAIRLGILNPIQYSDRVRNIGGSLKRGVLLAGPYGTGKTLTAFQVAKHCMEHGWTFLYLEDVRDLDLAINFAKLYQPCVLFAEDVDKTVSGVRTPEMDRLLNTIDGVESKGDKSLITVLTTNNLDAIHRSFLRPGRIDTVIRVNPPDLEACVRIVKKYVAEGGCKLIGTDDELQVAVKPLLGANAAFLRNAVEAAKLSALEHMADDDSTMTITAEDLAIVSKALLDHCRLINPEHGKAAAVLDMEGEMIDPMHFAMDIAMQKMAEAFVGQITNPKVLGGIIAKSMKRGKNGDPSVN